MDDKVGGIAVHIGARVAKHAQPGEVLVSSTVKDLVAGSGLRFRERGSAELKGLLRNSGCTRLNALASGFRSSRSALVDSQALRPAKRLGCATFGSAH